MKRGEYINTLSDLFDLYDQIDPNTRGCRIPKKSDGSDFVNRPVFYAEGRRMSMAREILSRKLGRPLLNGMMACHTCDVENCISEDHLFEGTAADNIGDCIDKGRFAVGSRHGSKTMRENWSSGDSHYSRTNSEKLARGRNHGSVKLTEEDVREIRRRYASGESSLKIAAAFDIAKSHSISIIRRKLWSHIE